jgi:hypothetical protein
MYSCAAVPRFSRISKTLDAGTGRTMAALFCGSD